MRRAPALVAHLAATVSAQRAVIEQILSRADRLDDPRVLHDLRVALRRTAAVARLTRGIPDPGSGDPLRLAARNLRRSLSPSRTREVCAALLAVRFRRDPGRRKAAATLAERIGPKPKESRPRRRAGDRRLLLLRRAFALRDAELARLARPFSFLGGGASDAELAARVRRRLRKKRRRLLAVGVPNPDAVHAARIAAKDLRYALEFVREIVPGVPELLRVFQAFQDTAGNAHDRIELIALVEGFSKRGSPALRRAASRLLPALRLDAERAVRRAQAAYRRLAARLEEIRLTFE